MEIKEKQIFNLMDTNGRRTDVVNALKVYLEILEELREEYPAQNWDRYPNSLFQFLFYEKALDRSREVFKKHQPYDALIHALGEDRERFLARDPRWIREKLPRLASALDEGVEDRARHYTSNLVKMGLTNSRREITPAGQDYLKGRVERDPLEYLLPLDDMNILLLRQLAKLRVFGAPREGACPYYAPFYMALALLLEGAPLDLRSFQVLVQGLSPYASPQVKAAVADGALSPSRLEEMVAEIPVELPPVLRENPDPDLLAFQSCFRSSKNTPAVTRVYYALYSALKAFRERQDQAHYEALLECLDGEGASLLAKAFGFGRAVFAAGNRGNRYSLEKFLEKNQSHPLLVHPHFLEAFYAAFVKSKWVDGIREYSDTTLRLLGATGLFRFRALPRLAYREVLELIFGPARVRSRIFGEMPREDALAYESGPRCPFGQSLSLSRILGYTPQETRAITQRIQALLGVRTPDQVRALLDGKQRTDFLDHIHKKYPREKILELLPLFSDRKNDGRIRKEVNDAASAPTIYEFLVGIAWYYLSREEFDLYASLNLTLNADFEPVVHAGAGEGDMVVRYWDMVVMLEMTLMNQQAQKRGEWEPVLRHALNLKAACEPLETITFFIADVLDYNTINIWRAVAAVSLESTNTHARVEGAVIMPFTHRELAEFLRQGVYYRDIIQAVKDSFARLPRIDDVKWQEDILEQVLRS